MDEITQQQIDRLKRIDAGNRARVKKFKDKAIAAGYRQITAMVDGMTFEELCKRRDRSVRDGEPLSFADIIKQALFQGRQDNVTANDINNIKVEPKEPEYSLFDCLDDAKATDTDAPKPAVKPAHVPLGDPPAWKDKKAYREYLRRTIPGIIKDMGPKEWQAKADKINAEGILSTTGKAWSHDNVRQFK